MRLGSSYIYVALYLVDLKCNGDEVGRILEFRIPRPDCRGNSLGVRRRWSVHCGGETYFPIYQAMNVENRPLVTDKPVEFPKQPVDVQDFRKITQQHLRRI